MDKGKSKFEYAVFSGLLDSIKNNNKCLINTINQYSYCIAEKDPEFKTALKNSDILLPDGVGITAAVKFLNGQRIKKIAGADIHLHLLQELNSKAGRCFYLGASENTLAKIKERISKEFPLIQVETFSPLYKSEFSEQDNLEMLNAVNTFKPDVLFIGMTAPKQEKWAYKHKEVLDAHVICSIGAVFDFYAGTVKRPHPFWIKLKLEWFVRLVKEPKRMWRRYLYYGPVFVYLIFRVKVGGR
ncbi:MAG: WecB/TagA/CpsF family glycosyltransferase [Bacteroidota bacterium]|nr:WecB/TagA/CpsF family glycosyltransferase [Bacteroidota bacterium]